MSNNLSNQPKDSSINKSNHQVESLIERTFNSFKKNYTLIKKTRVRSWKAYLIIGLIAGIIVGIVLVANRSLKIEESEAGGITYYVSPTGSDTNPGTQSQPFKTIQKAVNLMNPGDTTIVKGGTYNKGFIVGIGEGASAKSGTAAKPITVKAATGETVIITNENPFIISDYLPDKPRSAIVRFEGRSFWTMDGLNFLFASPTQPSGLSTIWLRNGEGYAIKNGSFDGNENGKGTHVVQVGAMVSNVLVENNTFERFPADYDIYGVAIGSFAGDPKSSSTYGSMNNVTVRGNTFNGLGGDGVQAWGGEDIIIENNKFSRFYTDPMEENAVDIKRANRVTIRNNIMGGYQPKSSGGGPAIIIHNFADNVTVDGNIIYDSWMGISLDRGNFTEVQGDSTFENIKIIRNVIFNTKKMGISGDSTGAGMRVWYPNVNGLLIAHNVFAHTEGPGMIILRSLLSFQGVEIKNNIFYANNEYAINFLSDAATYVTVGTNDFFKSSGEQLKWGGIIGNLSQFKSSTGQAGNSINSNPIFVNPTIDPGLADYHLQAGSPAINI
ncbi:MAG: hypothetical protein A2815_01800, partial [Candidatus Portnoybacteria bacterium RIFCSPHIGHO2_01_FULL_40_12b]